MKKEKNIQELQRDSLQELSEKDLLFLIKSYVTKRRDYKNIANLIRGDEDIIGKMIDSDRVFSKVINCKDRILEVSPYFLFSLLLRRTLREKREDTEFIEETIEILNSTESVTPWNRNRLLQRDRSRSGLRLPPSATQTGSKRSAVGADRWQNQARRR